MVADVAVRAHPVEQFLVDRQARFEAMLPPSIPFNTFRGNFMASVMANKSILNCDQESLFIACIAAAEDGLLPNGREAAIVPFANKATYVPMIAGLRKLAWGSSLKAAIQTHLVYEGEDIAITRGTSPEIIHHVTLDSLNQGVSKVIGAYAVAALPDGRKLFEIMGRAEIDRFMKGSKNQRDDSPWKQWPEQMIRSRPAKRLLRSLPLNSNHDEDRRAIAAAARYDADIEGTVADDAPSAPVQIAGSAHLEEVLGVAPPMTAPERIKALPEVAAELARPAIPAEPKAEEPEPEPPAPKRRGRPAGAKNRPKDAAAKASPVVEDFPRAAYASPALVDPPAPIPPAPASVTVDEAIDAEIAGAQEEADQAAMLYNRGYERIQGAVDFSQAVELDRDLQGTYRDLALLDNAAAQDLRDRMAEVIRRLTPAELPAASAPMPEPISTADAEYFALKLQSYLKPHATLSPSDVVEKIRALNVVKLARIEAHHPEIFRKVDAAMAAFDRGF